MLRAISYEYVCKLVQCAIAHAFQWLDFTTGMGRYLFYDAPIARVRAGREGQCSYKDNRVRLNSKLCITMQLANYYM